MPRNVLQLIDSFQQGGTERQVVQLTRLLAARGRYRVHVACLSDAGPLRAEIERLNLGACPVFPLTSFYDRNMLTQTRRFVRFLRAREIDLVHAHDFYCNIFGMAAATLARVPPRIAARGCPPPTHAASSPSWPTCATPKKIRRRSCAPRGA